MARHLVIDRPLLMAVLALVAGGFFIFTSAALGLLAKGGVSVASLAASHLILGLGFGSVSLYILSRIDFRFWRPFTPYLFIAALVLTALVFVPGVGHTAGGATRWLHIAGLSLQPSELLKIAAALFAAHFFAQHRTLLHEMRWGLGGLAGIMAPIAGLLLLQPDTDTLVVIAAGVGAIFFAAGARWRDIGGVLVVSLLVLTALLFQRDYLRDRLMTFLDPSSDPHGTSYQVRQAIIAVGSGEVLGRGFGQSIQKFGTLPEPVNDSIFAVASEEFGFLGSSALVVLFLFLIARLLHLSTRVPDAFGAFTLVGIAAMLGTQSFMNIAAMLGLIPLTGIPLPFISQGGTALFVALSIMGIALSISRHART